MAILLPPIEWKTFIAAPAARVFETLTTAAGWDGWFTRGATIEARVGGKLVMRWRDAAAAHHRVTLWGTVHEDVAFECPITVLDRDARFAFDWNTAGHPTSVGFVLATRGNGTIVQLRESGYTTDDLGATGVTGAIEQRSPYAMCASGWGEALALLKLWLEHDIAYGAVPPMS